jgi:hypothetical protein
VPGGNSSPYIKRLWPSRYPLQPGRTRSGNWSSLRSRKAEKQFVGAGVGIAEERQSARVGQICIAVANNVRGIQPSFRITRGQESDCAEPIFLIFPVRLQGRQAP